MQGGRLRAQDRVKGGTFIGKCTDHLATTFAKLASKGCPADAPAATSRVDLFVADVVNALKPVDNKCQAGKIRAAAKKSCCEFLLAATAAKKARTLPDFSKCKSAFSDAFAKLDNRGGCTTTNDATVIEDKVDDFFGSWFLALTASTPETPFKRNANGLALANSVNPGYLQLMPSANMGPTPYNCLAWAKGLNNVWISPQRNQQFCLGGAGNCTAKPFRAGCPCAANGDCQSGVCSQATIAAIMANDSCVAQNCPAPLKGSANPCPAAKSRLVLLTYRLAKGKTAPAAPACPNENENGVFWAHAMSLLGNGWVSKSGEGPDSAKIDDPEEFMDLLPEYRAPAGGTRSLCCFCCP